MSLSLTIADNADGTGGVASITGSSGTVTLYQAIVTASSNGSFTSYATRSGDGTIALTAPVTAPEYARWYASTLLLTSNTVYQPLTAKGDSVYERCFTMLQDRIRSLDLPGIDDAQIYVREIPDIGPNMSLPCVLLTDFGNAEGVVGGDNLHDMYAYPISVAIIDRKSTSDDESRRRFLHCRERIHRAIDQQKWDLRVPEVWKCEVIPAQVVNADWADEFSLRMSAMLITCTARQLRRTA